MQQILRKCSEHSKNRLHSIKTSGLWEYGHGLQFEHFVGSFKKCTALLVLRWLFYANTVYKCRCIGLWTTAIQCMMQLMVTLLVCRLIVVACMHGGAVTATVCVCLCVRWLRSVQSLSVRLVHVLTDVVHSSRQPQLSHEPTERYRLIRSRTRDPQQFQDWRMRNSKKTEEWRQRHRKNKV